MEPPLHSDCYNLLCFLAVGDTEITPTKKLELSSRIYSNTTVALKAATNSNKRKIGDFNRVVGNRKSGRRSNRCKAEPDP